MKKKLREFVDQGLNRASPTIHDIVVNFLTKEKFTVRKSRFLDRILKWVKGG